MKSFSAPASAVTASGLCSNAVLAGKFTSRSKPQQAILLRSMLGSLLGMQLEQKSDSSWLGI